MLRDRLMPDPRDRQFEKCPTNARGGGGGGDGHCLN